MQRIMLKISTLLVLVTLLSGCYAKYEINFTKDNMIEDKIYVYTESDKVNSLTKTQEDEIFNRLLDFERGYDHYTRETYTTEQFSGYQYSYNFNYEEYDAMSQLRKCYDTLTLNTLNELTLQTSKEFLCGDYYKEAQSMEITITSDYFISSSNADKTEGNKHTWIINKTNYKNKPISIKFDTNTIIEEEKESQIPKIIITFIIFITLIIFVIKNRKKYKI